ncbi:tripartite tricarboxylate transporter substrate binding protein [Pollutimonas sp. H1-120]|uniref:tripartite tricarboxylate transporter substrate binding protein n=1 Tax=Pollutimonas sp. H1-120 TaxID=3148824 RepID=UPI003B5260D3
MKLLQKANLPQLVLASLIAITAMGLPASVRAAWPEKPLRIVVPSSPGGSADAVARMVGDRLSRTLGQPVVVEDKGGGGGNIATDIVAKSAADGYSLLLTGNNHTVNVSLFKPAPYQLSDFAPIIELTRGPSVFVAANNAPYDTLSDLIKAAKANPGSIPFGSPGIGLPSHIAFEMFAHTTGIKMIHAPYRGSGPSLSDAAGGQIPIVTATLAAAMPLIKAGKLKALAVTSEERWPSLSEVPTVTEVIGQAFQHLTWLGVLAPAGTPEAVIKKLNTEINAVLQDPKIKATLDTLGTNPVGGSNEAFHQMIENEARTSATLIQNAGIKTE